MNNGWISGRMGGLVDGWIMRDLVGGWVDWWVHGCWVD